MFNIIREGSSYRSTNNVLVYRFSVTIIYNMDCYDLVIVGAGASGLIAGIESLKNGMKNVLIIDREEALGGNLNLFIHHGFGKNFIGANVTGPEYATILSRMYYELGGHCKLGTEVINISADKKIKFINQSNGLSIIEAKSILLATGCREKFTGNITVPKNKYTDIYTIGSAHRLINFEGYLPGKEVMIVGKSKWALILARRLTVEGCKVKGIIYNSDICDLNEYAEIIRGFPIEIINKCEIFEVLGDDKIEGIKLKNMENGTENIIACDSLILSVAYSPNIDMINGIETETIGGQLYPKVSNYETSIPGIFACGTILYGEDRIDSSDIDGLEVSKVIKELT